MGVAGRDTPTTPPPLDHKSPPDTHKHTTHTHHFLLPVLGYFFMLGIFSHVAYFHPTADTAVFNCINVFFFFSVLVVLTM